MAGVPQKTLSWLYDVLKREYRDPNRTYSDLAYVLSRNHGFAPRTDVYTFENGVSALLVHFKGTIPVNFRGNVYRFPISLWVPHTYPHEPPMCYVTPTDDMVIRPGQYVGGDGKVYHPYLAHWREAWERSNLVDFLSILADVFAKEPPVVAKGQLQQQRPTQPTPPPVPPLPRELAQHQSPVPVSSPPPLAAQQQYQGGPPPPPPKPAAHPGSQSPSGSPGQRLSRYDVPPPLPPHQQSPPGQRPQHPYGNGDVPRSPTGMNYMPQRTSSLRQSMIPQQQQQQPQYRPQPPRPGESQQYAQQQGPQGPYPGQPYDPRSQANQYNPQPLQQQDHSQYAGGQQYPPGQGPPPPQQQRQPQPHPHYQVQPHPQHHQQQPQPQQPHSHPKPAPPPDLLDSPFEISLPSATNVTSNHPNSSIPAPPIPVNPEKEALLTHLSHTLTQSLHSQIAQSTSALPALQSQNAALQSTLSTLSAELNNLQSLHSTLSSNLSLLSTSLSKSDGVISSARQRANQNDIPAVDDMLVPPTVVARQLYDAACEERGIEDAILALQEGFVRGRVGPDVWSRKTRELAREGFRRRWMERKVARGMGLDLSNYGSS